MLNRRPSQIAQANADQPPPVDEWRRYRRALRWRIVVIAALLAIGAVLFTVLRDVGTGGVPQFNRCIRQTRSLVLIRHRSPNGVIETITDRADGVLEGEVADDRAPSVNKALRGIVPRGESPPILGGAEVGGGPYILSTYGVSGSDVSAILLCWNGPFHDPGT